MACSDSKRDSYGEEKRSSVQTGGAREALESRWVSGRLWRTKECSCGDEGDNVSKQGILQAEATDILPAGFFCGLVLFGPCSSLKLELNVFRWRTYSFLHYARHHSSFLFPT